MNTFTIFTGDSKTMNLKVVAAGNYDPLDLTTCTEIDVALPLAGGGFAHRLLSDSQVTVPSPATSGKFNVSVPSDVSALLKVGTLQGFDVTFTIGSVIKTVRFENALSVFERPIVE